MDTKMEDESLRKAQRVYVQISDAETRAEEELFHFDADGEYMKDIVFACQRYFELGKRSAFSQALGYFCRFYSLTQPQIDEWMEKGELKK